MNYNLIYKMADSTSYVVFTFFLVNTHHLCEATPVSNKSTTTNPPQSKPDDVSPDIGSYLLFYTSPVITLVVLVCGVSCISHLVRKYCYKGRSRQRIELRTVSGTVDTGGSSEPPPPPYTYFDESCENAVVTSSPCPPYVKEPPKYEDIIQDDAVRDTTPRAQQPRRTREFWWLPFF